MDEQMSIFEYVDKIDKDPIENTTCVVLNGVCVNMTWEELFDATNYDTLKCVTYVSSPGFFMKSTSGFSKVQLIIGIEKEDVRKALAENIQARINAEGTRFFEELSDDDKSKIISMDYDIKFSKPDCIIHSKFYLLSNSKNGNNRLITGSANFSNTAFDNRIAQYEDIQVFDNDLRFEIYQRRFGLLAEHADEYVPRDVIDKYRTGEWVSLLDLTTEEKTEELINILRRDNIIPVCTETILNAMQEAQSDEERKSYEMKASFEVITTSTKKKKGGKKGELMLKENQEMDNAKKKIQDILFRHTKTEQDIRRFSMTFNPMDKKQYIIFPREDGLAARKPEIMDRYASIEEIKRSIENIEKFLQAYELFVTDKETDDNNISRIYEILLYAFMSAYVFMLRENSTTGKANIPLILVIGGRAYSGKSNLLAYIDRILSGRKMALEDHYIHYKDVDKSGAISDLFHSDNTYPILVDEVAPAFFSSKAGNKGEELIKYLSNSLDGRHPAMICTTNTGAFNIPAQVSRRIYFVKVDTCFDERQKPEASVYYNSVMKDADNVLFRDFCARMSEKIKSEACFVDEKTRDYLHIGREIFNDYYREIGKDIPTYFPSGLYNDYENRGKSMWKTLYTQASDKFVYKRKTKGKVATYTIPLKELMKDNKDAGVYINYLKQDLLIEEAGLYVVIKADAFCKWIGAKKRRRLLW